MPDFTLYVRIDQTVTKEVQLLVQATDIESATERAKQAVTTFPDKVEVEGVKRIVSNRSNYWPPSSITVLNAEEGRGNWRP